MNGSLMSYGGTLGAGGPFGGGGGGGREVDRLLDQNFKRVKMLLEENRAAMVAVAEALIEKHALMGDEVYELVRQGRARAAHQRAHQWPCRGPAARCASLRDRRRRAAADRSAELKLDRSVFFVARARASSSRALLRAVSVTAPASIAASSSRRAGSSRRAMAVVPSARVTTKWASAKAATWAMWVTHSTWWPGAGDAHSFSPTTGAVRPPTPMSISSKISVGRVSARGEDRLERQRDARQLAARGDARHRARLSSTPSVDLEFDVVHARGVEGEVRSPMGTPSGSSTCSMATQKRAQPRRKVSELALDRCGQRRGAAWRAGRQALRRQRRAPPSSCCSAPAARRRARRGARARPALRAPGRRRPARRRRFHRTCA